MDQRDTLEKLRAEYYKLHLRPVLREHKDAKATGDSVALARLETRAVSLAEDRAPYAGMVRYLFRRAGLLS